MGKYQVITSPDFRKEFYDLPKNLQTRVKKILKKLEDRLCGEPLKGDLKGLYSIHFERNHYRLIYSQQGNILKILVLHVGKRTDDFYKKIKEEIERRLKTMHTF